MQQKKNGLRTHWKMAAALLTAGVVLCTPPAALMAAETDGDSLVAASSAAEVSVSEPAPAPEVTETPTPAAEPTVTPELTPEVTETPTPTPGEESAETPTPTPEATETPTPEPTEEPEKTDEETGEKSETDEKSEDASKEESEEDEKDEEETDEEREERERKEKEEAEKAGYFELRVAVEGKGKVRIRYADEEGKPVEVVVEPEKSTPVRIKKDTEVLLLHEEETDSLFSEWKVVKGAVQILQDRFVMPEGEVEIQAVFEDIHAEGASKEAQEANAKRPKRTNAELIAAQNIQALPVAKRDFRFWTVEKNMQFVRSSMPILDDIGTNGSAIAVLPTNGVVNVLEEVDTDWLYVESGRARGFIPKDSFVSESERTALMSAFNRLNAGNTEENGSGSGSQFLYADLTVPESENKAFLYRKCTAEQTVIEKEYVTPAGEGTDILEEPAAGARVCGVLQAGSLGYLIKDAGDGWLYIESGDVRGFVRNEELHIGSRARVEVRMAGGEEQFSSCQQLVAPEDNGATYYTLTSVKAGTPTNPVREAIIKSAEQCLGHPYVWGGTSLLGGCDCSGFVQGLYGLYGYSIPRIAENQSEYGRQIPVDNAQPGDLIFFAKDGYVYHVALYVGNDQTIEAYGTAYGIIRNRVDHANAVWATRIIED